MSQWGGARNGAGRKPGNSGRSENAKVISFEHGGARPNSGPKGKYGEPTKPMRVPASLEKSVLHYIENKGFNLPVFVMKVPMGQATLSFDQVDRTFNLNELIKHPDKTFFHPVEGDSMEPTIFAGDLAMIDAAVDPMHNDVVLASIEGALTLKRLIKAKDLVWLASDNKKYKPIMLNREVDNMVCGVMVFSIRPISPNHIKAF